MSLENIAAISREFGSNEDYVLAGGGNTSWKDDEFLYIKASGFALATIQESGFVKMDRSRLAEIWSRKYPDDTAAREKAALADLMAARAAGETEKRPSVETSLHEAIDEQYVVHTHPSLVNGLTCSMDGEDAARRLLGEQALWIPMVNPGYVLAVTVRNALIRFQEEFGISPVYILLQNHGVFISGETCDVIKERYARLFEILDTALIRVPGTGKAQTKADLIDVVAGRISDCYANIFSDYDGSLEIEFVVNEEIISI
ncbi:MAG: class II aldolase, partial [Spirochaetales bacterium]|nr:class II aldolase [Spirochaetales bacterium]